MARRKQKQKQTNNQKEVENLNKISQDIDQLKESENITEEELEKIEVEINASNLQVKNIENKFKEVNQIKSILEKKKKELEEALSKSKDEAEEFESKKKDLDELIKRYDAELIEINQLRSGNFANIIDKKIIDKYSESLEEQKKLLLSEIEKLKGEQGRYIELITSKEKEILESQTAIANEKLKLNAEFQQKFLLKEDDVSASKRALDKLKKQFTLDVEDFEDEKDYLKERARKQVEEELEKMKKTITLLEEKGELLLQEIEDLKDLERHFGGRDPKRVINELNEANDTIYELQGKLDLSPDSLKIDELKRLRQEKINWKDELSEALATSNEYKQRWDKEQLSIGEKETLEFQKEELEKRIELQQIALDEFQKVLDKSNAQEVFTSCIEMDGKYHENKDLGLDNGFFNTNWTHTIQQKLASRKVAPLYYDENIIRSFVGGLAMSRLNILQGISGTGKTSLPEAFAKAIGGYSKTIEVQSGWKDRQDLIGYYNTFEKKFYESEFLKALYMANTPEYKNKPFFIILDEMNLSHPEHYFADILSLMEKTTVDDQQLKICDRVNGKPELMVDDDGTFKLQIPDNVWFIGTANHDETTLQFAPKTYDRANVMEMPKNHKKITIDSSIDTEYVLMDSTSLRERFEEHSYDMNKIDTYLSNEGSFKSICNELGIGWGNRLEKQMQKFIPVFISLGGTEADAIDHLLSSKILRNIQGRYDLQESVLNKMKDELENYFVQVFDDYPTKCLDLVEQEINKK